MRIDWQKGLLGGVSGKIISLKLGEESARAYAIDLGLQYDLSSILVPIRVGAAVQNWGTRIHFIDENQSDPLPRLFRFGTVVPLYNQGNHQLRLIGDLTASIDQLRKDEDELRMELSVQISATNRDQRKSRNRSLNSHPKNLQARVRNEGSAYTLLNGDTCRRALDLNIGWEVSWHSVLATRKSPV